MKFPVELIIPKLDYANILKNQFEKFVNKGGESADTQHLTWMNSYNSIFKSLFKTLAQPPKTIKFWEYIQFLMENIFREKN